MKKITTITGVAFLAITVVSCSKPSSDYSSVTSVNQASTKQEVVKVRIISDWQSLSLAQITLNGSPVLQGQTMLTQIVSYEMGMHKQLAYVKMPGREGAIYKALPTNYLTQDGSHSLSFSLDLSTFKVNISNSDFPARTVNAANFSGFQFRYIVISAEVYQSTQIDWNDLPAVAAAFNFSL